MPVFTLDINEPTRQPIAEAVLSDLENEVTELRWDYGGLSSTPKLTAYFLSSEGFGFLE